MGIERTVHNDGSWEEKATGKKAVQELLEKHGPALQKRGNEDFHKKWMEQVGVGFEKVRDPAGNPTHVRADQVDVALGAQGYSPMNRPTTIVPDLPWHTNHVPRYGKHKYRYNPESKTMEEV